MAAVVVHVYLVLRGRTSGSLAGASRTGDAPSRVNRA